MADISDDLQQELDQLQADYKAAVDKWVAAIREEEALASGNHSVAELDEWEAAHFREHKLHKEVDYRKRLYENALRREFYGF
jgi:thiamine monophosphate kinase